MLRGFGALILIPAAGIALLFTVIGAPVAVVVFLSYGILLILSGIMAPILLGSAIWRLIRRSDAYEVNAYAVIVGVSAFGLLGLIPVIGWIAGFVFVLVASGTLYRATALAFRSAQEGSKRHK
jgi:hypothetical protein